MTDDIRPVHPHGPVRRRGADGRCRGSRPSWPPGPAAPPAELLSALGPSSDERHVQEPINGSSATAPGREPLWRTRRVRRPSPQRASCVRHEKGSSPCPIGLRRHRPGAAPGRPLGASAPTDPGRRRPDEADAAGPRRPTGTGRARGDHRRRRRWRRARRHRRPSAARSPRVGRRRRAARAAPPPGAGRGRLGAGRGRRNGAGGKRLLGADRPERRRGAAAGPAEAGRRSTATRRRPPGQPSRRAGPAAVRRRDGARRPSGPAPASRRTGPGRPVAAQPGAGPGADRAPPSPSARAGRRRAVRPRRRRRRRRRPTAASADAAAGRGHRSPSPPSRRRDRRAAPGPRAQGPPGRSLPDVRPRRGPRHPDRRARRPHR